jgi:Kef-type K+ transport system membrane component KefB
MVTSFLEVLGVYLVVAAGVVLLTRRFKVPTIVAYLLAGLVAGPLLGWVDPAAAGSGALEVVGELGIVLLMFLVGLELSLDRLRQVGGVAVAAGIGQVVFTAAGGVVIAKLMGFTWMESVFLATALTFSSTVVVVKLLDQKGDLHRLYGRIAIGIFLVQDLVVVIILTLLAGLGRASGVDAAAVGLGLLKAFGGMIAMLAVALLAARYLLPRPLAWASQRPRTLVVWSLTWCLALVWAAHALSLSAEIGAFLAGLAVAQLGCAHELRRRMHPLMTFFVAVFFVSLGARMDLSAAGSYLPEAIVLSLFVLVGNPFIFMLIIARFGYAERTCFDTSVTVAQISEFSLIFAAMGVSAGLISGGVLAVVAVVGLVTMVASAYLILYSGPLYDWLAPKGVLRMFRARQGEERMEARDERRSGHVIVVGMNDLGLRVVTDLHRRGLPTLAVDTDPRKLALAPGPTLVGDIDFAATCEEADLPLARAVVCTLRIASVHKLLTHRCRQAGVPVAVHGFDGSVDAELLAVGPDLLMAPRGPVGQALAAGARGERP